jgi:hypothetical protein
MAIRLNVPFVWQKKMMECWYACMQMLTQYANGTTTGKMKSQAPTHGDTKTLRDANEGASQDDIDTLARKLNVINPNHAFEPVYETTSAMPMLGQFKMKHFEDALAVGPFMVKGMFGKLSLPYGLQLFKKLANVGRRVGCHWLVVIGTTDDERLILNDPWSGPGVTMSLRGFNKNFDDRDRGNMWRLVSKIKKI